MCFGTTYEQCDPHYGEMKALQSQNFYEILNVSRYASQEEIRKAYEISKHTFQGDSLATYTLYSEDENEEIFGLITDAYETLRNPSLRREYDTFLSSRDGKTTGTEEERKTASAVFGKAAEQNIPKSPMQGSSTGFAAPTNNGIENKEVPTAVPDQSDRMGKFLATVKHFDGQTLKKARHLAGCSLDELSDQTKIRKTYLEYIEEEKFKDLPASVYVKGFVIILANTYGLPSQRVAKDYMERFDEGRL